MTVVEGLLRKMAPPVAVAEFQEKREPVIPTDALEVSETLCTPAQRAPPLLPWF